MPHKVTRTEAAQRGTAIRGPTQAQYIAARMFELDAERVRTERPKPTIRRFSWEDQRDA